MYCYCYCAFATQCHYALVWSDIGELNVEVHHKSVAVIPLTCGYCLACLDLLFQRTSCYEPHTFFFMFILFVYITFQKKTDGDHVIHTIPATGVIGNPTPCYFNIPVPYHIPVVSLYQIYILSRLCSFFSYSTWENCIPLHYRFISNCLYS